MSDERLYRGVFDTLEDGFCVIRMVFDGAGAPVDYVFLETNPAFARHTGMHDAVGRNMRSYFPAHEAFWYQFYARVVETGEPASTQFRADAMGRWYESHASRFGAREDAQVAVIFKDISAQKKVEQQKDELLTSESAARAQAEAASRQKDEFLASLSHELRTPLHAMLGWLHMMRDVNMTAERRERALATVERNARAQAQLIEDLLDVSGILFGKLHIQLALTDMASAVHDAIDALRPAAEKKSIALDVQVAPGAMVRGDGARLTQIASNLLGNALKFTPSHGRVEVNVEADTDWVTLTIRDSGQGISADFLPHVFERFRQQDSGPTRPHGGLGLGLSIAQQLVGLHGGSISVESEGSGRGATFRVKLRACPERVERAALPTPATPPSTTLQASAPSRLHALDGLEILVVDDEPDAREVIRELLVQSGAKVRVAASADEALRAFAARPPHLLISDLGMPQRGGHALIRRVRQLELQQGGEVPAIALTAYARNEDRDQALRAGFTTHVAKPVAPDDLLSLVASLTHRAG